MSTDRKSYKNADLWLFSPAITKKMSCFRRKNTGCFYFIYGNVYVSDVFRWWSIIIMHEVMKSVLFESQTSQPIHLYPSNVGLREANDSITINQTDICENPEGAWECHDSHVCKFLIFFSNADPIIVLLQQTWVSSDKVKSVKPMKWNPISICHTFPTLNSRSFSCIWPMGIKSVHPVMH